MGNRTALMFGVVCLFSALEQTPPQCDCDNAVWLRWNESGSYFEINLNGFARANILRLFAQAPLSRCGGFEVWLLKYLHILILIEY